jgi:hypothetical protein
MAEHKSDVQQMLDSHEGSPDPSHRANPFGEGEAGFDLERIDQEQQAAANPEPVPDAASEDEPLEFDPDAAAAYLEGKIDSQGYPVQHVPEDAVEQMREQGYDDDAIEQAFLESGLDSPFEGPDEPGTPAEEAEFANEEVEAREQALEELKQRHPALRDERVHQAILPELQELAELYGQDYIRNPKVIEEVYLRVDPNGEMAAQLDDEKTVSDIFKAGSGTSAFT